ncbi:type VI secretion protein [Caballeronia calidae]|uniref:Type VI secretion protein n=1 Tax=Caballeronia calidae TaxID=1777139 RepID=A0A158ED16_9BURK|nr:type VI secretion protein [Caballeronia calidae]
MDGCNRHRRNDAALDRLKIARVLSVQTNGSYPARVIPGWDSIRREPHAISLGALAICVLSCTGSRCSQASAVSRPCCAAMSLACASVSSQLVFAAVAMFGAAVSGNATADSSQIADYAVADVSLFWLLHSVNTTWPELARLAQAPDQHPEKLYALLSRLAGSLLTFSTTETLQSIPAYDHRAPEPVFAELESLIRTLLDTVIPSRVVPIALERVRGTMWTGQIKDERLVEDADYYLSVQAGLPAHALIEQFPRLCKAGAPDEVEQIVNSALLGIPLKSMSRLPAAIPVRIENQYFALDSQHPAFTRMIAARACQFYVPASIPDVSIELYAVLPT